MTTNSTHKFIERFTPGKLPEHLERPVYESYKNSRLNLYKFLDSKYSSREDADRVKKNTRLEHHYYRSKWATDEEIQHVLTHGTSHDREFAILNRKITDKQLDDFLSSDDDFVREIVAMSPHLNQNHITKALSDQNANVRYNVVSNPNISKENLLRALNDSNYDVSYRAEKHIKYKEYFPNGHENL